MAVNLCVRRAGKQGAVRDPALLDSVTRFMAGNIGNITSTKKVSDYQVTATMLADETRERELKPLKSISDHYEKVVLSMDRTPVTDWSGIKNVNLLDFLLSE